MLRILGSAAIVLVVAGAETHAQASKPKYPVVCGKGVRVYTERAQLPAKRDSLAMPPAKPVRVTSPEEAEAAEFAMRERAGSVGATSLLVVTKQTDEADGVRMERSVSAFFIPSDSAAAQQACKKA